MQMMISQLTLANCSTWCYARSAFLMVLWSPFGYFGMDPSQLTVGEMDLCTMLQNVQNLPFQLNDFGWFRGVMQQWTEGSGQADAAEFQLLLLRILKCPDWLYKLEKRMI